MSMVVNCYSQYLLYLPRPKISNCADYVRDILVITSFEERQHVHDFGERPHVHVQDGDHHDGHIHGLEYDIPYSKQIGDENT